MEIKFEKVNFIYQPNTPLAKEVLQNINITIPENKISEPIIK